MSTPISQSFALPGSAAQFWMRFVILIMLAFFGYQTPNLPKLSGSGRWARERLQDTLLGIFLGVLNGYLIVGVALVFHGAGRITHPSATSSLQTPTTQ